MPKVTVHCPYSGKMKNTKKKKKKPGKGRKKTKRGY